MKYFQGLMVRICTTTVGYKNTSYFRGVIIKTKLDDVDRIIFIMSKTYL